MSCSCFDLIFKRKIISEKWNLSHFFILFFQLKQLWSERVTGRVFRLRAKLMKKALNEDNNRPHPIARKPVKTNKHVQILVYFQVYIHHVNYKSQLVNKNENLERSPKDKQCHHDSCQRMQHASAEHRVRSEQISHQLLLHNYN